MRKLLDALASLKLAVILLVLLLVGLAAGTIIESQQGVEVAGRTVYYAWWFLGLQALFAVNVIASLVSLFPWGKFRVGYLVTHASMLVILGGALTTYFFKSEGQLALWEGDSGNEVVDAARSGAVRSSVRLPFTVKLIAFRVDHYPGTMRPAQFTSDVEISEPGRPPYRQLIYMNHPLTVQGWTMFQSSYQQSGGRQATILSVSKDPGQDVAFLGYGLLVVGMSIVLGTRIQAFRMAQRRMQEAAEAAAAGPRKSMQVLGALALLAFAGAARAEVANLDALKRLPVQHDGRVMPLDTLARESVWKITGSGSVSGQHPVESVVSWWEDPRQAAALPLIPVKGELATAAGLPSSADRASFSQLVGSPRVLQLMDEARRQNAEGRQRQGVVADAEKVEERLVLLQGFINREAIRPMPVPGNLRARWTPAPGTTAAELAALAAGPPLPGWPTASEVNRELTYNTWRPARIAWIVLLAALILSLFAWNGRSKLLDGLAFAGLALGFAAMTWGIALRWQIGDRIPAANMYESMLFLSWGVGLFAVIAFAAVRNRIVVLNANGGAALAMLLVDLLPMDRFIHPTPPVLSGTPWLAIHVPIIMVSYSVLALGVVVAHMQIGWQIFKPEREDMAVRMHQLLYWYMQVGQILLIVGIFTGSIWAASSWGRYWGWDPKEVWSLVAWLAYIAILHGRWDRIIGPFGIAALSIVAFQTILMTYLGVNYVLGTGLHSYGFGDSPVVFWMVVVAVVEGAFLAFGWAAHRKRIREGGGGQLAAA
jgi:cytochrome c-type biogenesis protein CcsB